MSTAVEAVEVPQQPATSADERVGVNGAVAAALTRWIGSMPTLYLVLSVVGGWMALATWGPLHRVDPYPFPFLLFLDNVVQLVLCLVILVGQRVLGRAADRRAVQTYENAEAIFARVADLQAHLDRHDRTLSRGVSLLQASPHPWVQRHRVQPPPQATDQVIGVNGSIAAWLTQRLGSMWAFYAAAGTQVVWIGLAEVGAQRFDPYPFAFMTFLSTLAQLIFMIVIMVGQDVLGRAADRRSQQTFLDAEAILHECRRMKARLTGQDRIIDSLADYVTSQVTEHLAQAIHQTQLNAAVDDAEPRGVSPAWQPWEHLPQHLKQSMRGQAQRIGERLATIGCLMVPATDATQTFAFTDEELHLLARLEREQATTEATDPGTAQGSAYRPGRQDHTQPGSASQPEADAVPAPLWEQLSDEERATDLEALRRIPTVLAGVGFQILRHDRSDSPGEADFTLEEWATLQQALMTAGVLVSLAEGDADADEIVALINALREASITHPNQFIRELTAVPSFDTGLRPGTRYAAYKGPALDVIRSATTIVARTAPTQLDDFRGLLTHLAEVVADANNEGGLFGLGARPRVPSEAAAIEAIKQATEPHTTTTPAQEIRSDQPTATSR